MKERLIYDLEYLQNDDMQVLSIAFIRLNYKLEFIDMQSFYSDNERYLIELLAGILQNSKPFLIGFKNKSKDMSLVVEKSMKYNIDISTILNTGSAFDSYFYGQRYQLDLALDLWQRIPSLYELCKAINLPGKYEEGKQITELFAEQNFEKIREYNESDCLNILIIFYKYLLLKGELDKNNYLHNISCVKNYIKKQYKHRAYCPHFERFFDLELSEYRA